jgi:hypothetical protein
MNTESTQGFRVVQAAERKILRPLCVVLLVVYGTWESLREPECLWGLCSNVRALPLQAQGERIHQAGSRQVDLATY